MLAASRALPPRFPGLSILPSFKRTIFYVPLSSKTSITFFSIINSQLPLSLPILLRKYKKTSTCSPHVCRLMSGPLYAFPPIAMDELFMLPPAAKVRGNQKPPSLIYPRPWTPTVSLSFIIKFLPSTRSLLLTCDYIAISPLSKIAQLSPNPTYPTSCRPISLPYCTARLFRRVTCTVFDS